MINYRNYEIEDFICDDFFIEWVLNPNPANCDFWNKWQLQNKDRITTVKDARSIVLSIKVKKNDKQLTKNDVLNIMDYVKENGVNFHVDKESSQTFFPYKWFAIAASIICLFILGISYKYLLVEYQGQSDNQIAIAKASEMIKTYNKSKERLVIKLVDGSLVILTPNSTLTYPKTFSNNLREVSLVGSGFFDVQKNPGKPFIVHTKQVNTKVLGTSFSISESANEISKVVVYTGKVAVYTANAGVKVKQVTLTPNIEATYAPDAKEIKIDTLSQHLPLSIDVAESTFKFQQIPLSTIIEKLEIVYQIAIDYNKVKYSKTSVSGDLGNLSLDQKIKFICKAVNADYKIDGGRISIY